MDVFKLNRLCINIVGLGLHIYLKCKIEKLFLSMPDGKLGQYGEIK